MTDTPSVWSQEIRNAEQEFNKLLDHHQKEHQVTITVEVRKNRIKVMSIERRPEPEVLYRAEEEEAESE